MRQIVNGDPTINDIEVGSRVIRNFPGSNTEGTVVEKCSIDRTVVVEWDNGANRSLVYLPRRVGPIALLKSDVDETQPITPEETQDKWQEMNTLPENEIEVFNQLIVKFWNQTSQQSHVPLKEVYASVLGNKPINKQAITYTFNEKQWNVTYTSGKIVFSTRKQ